MTEAHERKELTEHERLWITDAGEVLVAREHPDDVPYVRADLYDEAVKQRDVLRKVCEDFVAKCDRGEARSVRSYAAMKDALAACASPPRAP